MNSFSPETSSVASHQGTVNSSMNSLKFKPEHKLREVVLKNAMSLKITETKTK